MPKGVYNRSKVSTETTIPMNGPIATEVGINKVQVSQMPDRQSANANVEALRQTHGDENISTTERLFGTIEEQNEINTQNPRISQEPLISQPVAQNPEQAEEPRFKEETPKPEKSKPVEDDFIDWDKMSTKKIRQKIDGKEVVITAEELKKYSDQDQISKHLADAASRVGQERRKLAEERQELERLRNRPSEAPLNQQSSGQPQDIGQSQYQQDPVYERLKFLEAQVQQLAIGTQPAIYESNRQRVSNELKAQGFNDFIDYLPKMESVVVGIKDPALVSFYDTPEGSKALYFQLKAQDLQKSPARPPVNVPRETVVANPTPPVTQIDGGSQSSGSYTDDSAHTYRSAFRRATSLGDDKEAWNEVLRQKGILPD